MKSHDDPKANAVGKLNETVLRLQKAEKEITEWREKYMSIKKEREELMNCPVCENEICVETQDTIENEEGQSVPVQSPVAWQAMPCLKCTYCSKTCAENMMKGHRCGHLETSDEVTYKVAWAVDGFIRSMRGLKPLRNDGVVHEVIDPAPDPAPDTGSPSTASTPPPPNTDTGTGGQDNPIEL